MWFSFVEGMLQPGCKVLSDVSLLNFADTVMELEYNDATGNTISITAFGTSECTPQPFQAFVSKRTLKDLLK